MAKWKPFRLNGVEQGDAGNYSYYRDAKGKKKKKRSRKKKQTLRPVTRLAPTPPPDDAYSVE